MTMAAKKKATKRATKATKAPTKKKRSAPFLRPGDFAKLVFRNEGERGTERMWVRVTRVVGRNYVGTLDSRPVAVRGIRAGASLTFPRSAVIQRMRAGQEPSATQRRQMREAGGNIRLLRRG